MKLIHNLRCALGAALLGLVRRVWPLRSRSVERAFSDLADAMGLEALKHGDCPCEECRALRDQLL